MAKATCSDLILFFFKSWKCQHLPYIFSVMLGAEKNLQAWWPFQKLCRPLQSFFSTGSIHKAPDISYVAGFKDLARQYRTLYLQMFCSPHEPFSSRTWGMSAPWNLFTRGFCHMTSALSRTASNLPATSSPKPWYLHHCVFRYRHNP